MSPSTLFRILLLFPFVLPSALLWGGLEQPAIRTLSFSTQGNGYNWGATLGWMAERMHQRVAEARAVEAATGREQVFHLVTVSGGSSGSAATLLIDALVRNPEIVSSHALSSGMPSLFPGVLLGVDDLERLGRAVRFISLGVDLGWQTTLSTSGRTLLQVFRSRADMISDHVPLIPDLLGGGRPKLWSHQLRGYEAVSDFGRLIQFAGILDRETLLMPIPEDSRTARLIDAFSTNPLADQVRLPAHLYEVPEVRPALLEPSRIGDLEPVAEILHQQSRLVEGIVRDRLKEHSGAFRQATNRTQARLIQLADPEDAPNPRSSLFFLQQPVSPGFMVAVLGREFADMDTMRKTLHREKGLQYPDLRPFILGSPETVELLLASPRYRRSLGVGRPAQRYCIGTVDTRFDGLNISVREPHLLEELVGPYSGDAIRIRSLFDPEADLDRTLTPLSTDSPVLKSRVLFVAGGFLLVEMTAFLPALLHLDWTDYWGGAGYEVTSIFETFQRPVSRGDIETREGMDFGQRQVTGTFNPGDDPLQAASNLDDWFLWKTDFAPLARRLNLAGSYISTPFSWDVYRLPAALAGKSEVLSVMAGNAARQTGQAPGAIDWLLVQPELK